MGWLLVLDSVTEKVDAGIAEAADVHSRHHPLNRGHAVQSAVTGYWFDALARTVPVVPKAAANVRSRRMFERTGNADDQEGRARDVSGRFVEVCEIIQDGRRDGRLEAEF